MEMVLYAFEHPWVLALLLIPALAPGETILILIFAPIFIFTYLPIKLLQSLNRQIEAIDAAKPPSSAPLTQTEFSRIPEKVTCSGCGGSVLENAQCSYCGSSYVQTNESLKHSEFGSNADHATKISH